MPEITEKTWPLPLRLNQKHPSAMHLCKKAEMVGALLAEKALNEGIKQVVFDRGGYRYHGRVKALAEAARKAGLEF